MNKKLLYVAALAAVAGNVSAATQEELDAANSAYSLTKGLVDDATHNALDAALKAAIENATVNGCEDIALVTATNNSLRHYYYDKLATLVITSQANVRYVNDEQLKSKLETAINTAALIYNEGNIDESKDPSEYADAAEALLTVAQNTLLQEWETAYNALSDELKDSTTLINNLAYDNNQADLRTYINAAQTTKADLLPKGYLWSSVRLLRSTKTTLDNNIATVQAADLAKAKEALNTAIANATKYNDDNLKGVSNVYYALIGELIETAQGVYDDENSTAIQLKGAATTLSTSTNNVVINEWAKFKENKQDLTENLSLAATLKATLTYDYDKGAAAYLQDAIDAAQTVLDASIDKTYEQLHDASVALETAEGVARGTHTSAAKLAGYITNANAAYDATVDATAKVFIKAAIDEVQPDLSDKTKLSGDLEADCTKLNSAIQQYVDADISTQRNALVKQIGETSTVITDVLVSNIYKNDLYVDMEDAETVKNNTSATAKQLSDATTTLKDATADYIAKDIAGQKDDLEKIISSSTSIKTDIAAKSTVIANGLQDAIDDAQDVLDAANEEGSTTTAKNLYDAKYTLNEAVKAANTALEAHETAATNLETAIATAKTTKGNYPAEHVGVIAQAGTAIAAAQAVDDAKVEKSTDELNTAKKTLEDAMEAATKADIAAGALETSIQNAKDVRDNVIQDASVKNTLDIEIAGASSLLKKEEATEAYLTSTKNILDNMVKSLTSSDISIAKSVLTDSINAAKSSLAILGLQKYYDELNNLISPAERYLSATHTAFEYLQLSSELNQERIKIVAADLKDCKASLSALIGEYSVYDVELKTLHKSIKQQTERDNFYDKVVDKKVGDKNDGFSSELYFAQLVRDDESSTAKKMVEEIAALKKDYEDANDAYTLFINTENQKLADAYTTDKGLDIVVKADVTVLPELEAYTTALDWAVEVSAAVKSGEPIVLDNGGELTPTVAHVIDARYGLETQFTALNNAWTAWKNARTGFRTVADRANTVWNNIQACHTDVKENLESAFNEAKKIVVDPTVVSMESIKIKTDVTTDSINHVTEALKTAIEKAIYDDTHWDFTDATPDYKEGQYVAGCVTYTRSGSYIAAGKFGSFCFPFAVSTSNFAKAYVPAPFAVYDASANTFKMFFKEVETTVIPAGTPFLAELPEVDDNTLTIKNIADVEIASAWDAATAPVALTTEIEVYDQTASSSFVTFDKATTFVWNGTFAKTTETTNCQTFGSNAGIYKAGSYISPFRAFFKMVTSNKAAKDANIIVNFGDDDDTTTAIESIINNVDLTNGKVYSVDGKFVGNSTKGLKSGMYIVNGKKVIK